VNDVYTRFLAEPPIPFNLISSADEYSDHSTILSHPGLLLAYIKRDANNENPL
jgi:hypothetical protein